MAVEIHFVIFEGFHWIGDTQWFYFCCSIKHFHTCKRRTRLLSWSLVLKNDLGDVGFIAKTKWAINWKRRRIFKWLTTKKKSPVLPPLELAFNRSWWNNLLFFLSIVIVDDFLDDAEVDLKPNNFRLLFWMGSQKGFVFDTSASDTKSLYCLFPTFWRLKMHSATSSHWTPRS